MENTLENAEKTITPEMARDFFSTLPKEEILAYAKNIQNMIMSGDETTIQKKNDGTLATEADTAIERMIVDCFNKSKIAKLCGVRGEEGVADLKKENSWMLLVDPIDGSSSLVKGADTWGVMVGLLDEKGILRYSWNAISTGEVFQTNEISQNSKKINEMKPLRDQQNVRIDFYDYKSGQEEMFLKQFENVTQNKCELTSCPAAISAGWQLYSGKLSALVWVPGENEKKMYPDYDLVFLAPLVEQGFCVQIGKSENGENAIVIVAPTKEDADALYGIAESIAKIKSEVKISKSAGLKI